MPSRQALQKLRRHLNGLENWPMSSSYPQESGEEEARVMAKTIRENLQSERVETTVTLQKDSGWCNSFLRKLQQLLLIDGEDVKEDVDEVDGRTEDVLRPLVKLYFLKILFIDIGISFGDLVTDFAQGLNLIFDSNWNILWSTAHYGLLVLAIIWLPSIPMILHILLTRKTKYFSEGEQLSASVFLAVLFVIFFPILPTLMYVKILQLFHFYTGGQFLLPQGEEGWKRENGFHPT